jgi:TRAP-type C4-dicarboxylate transport system permease small subunit
MKNAFLTVGRGVTVASLGFACLMLVLSSCLGMFQVITRFIFEQPAEWSEVLIRFFLIWMVFMGLPEAFRLGSMVSIDLAHRLAPKPLQRILDVIILLASLALLAVIIWYGWDYAQRGKVQSMAGLEELSMFWAYLALPVGAACAIFGAVANFIEPQHLELETAQ